MSEMTKKQSPLVSFQDVEQAVSGSIGVNFVERPFNGFYNLRLDPDSDIRQSAESALGCSLPLQANTRVAANDISVYWLGPDEWLIRTRSEDDQSLYGQLKEVLAGSFSSVVDNSGGMTVISVSGAEAENILRQGTTFDLHHSVFSPGQCAQTVLSHAGMLISCEEREGERVFDLMVRRSFADYIMKFLQDGATDYGYSFSR